MVPRPLANGILVVVSIVWVGNFLATVFVPGYQNDPAINFVFATIVGGALTLRGAESGGDGLLHRLSAALRPPLPPPPPADPGPPPQGGDPR